jgi:hypothetical protein
MFSHPKIRGYKMPVPPSCRLRPTCPLTSPFPLKAWATRPKDNSNDNVILFSCFRDYKFSNKIRFKFLISSFSSKYSVFRVRFARILWSTSIMVKGPLKRLRIYIPDTSHLNGCFSNAVTGYGLYRFHRIKSGVWDTINHWVWYFGLMTGSFPEGSVPIK